MFGAQSYRRVTDAFSDSLSVIFAAVNADHYQLRRISLFELPQLREYVNAVDSPVGPEIEKNNFSAQIDEAQRTVAGMYPVEIRWKVGCPYRRSRREFSRHLKFGKRVLGFNDEQVIDRSFHSSPS